MQPKSFVKPLLSALMAAGCVVSVGAIANAQQGINFRWNSRDQTPFLPFNIELSNNRSNWGRYRLRIGSGDMKLAAMQLAVVYPNYFDGQFDPKSVELRLCQTLGNVLSGPKGCKTVEIDEVALEKERNRISIYPKEPVPAGSNVEMVFSNVRNPRNQGMYQLRALVQSPGDVPLPRILGMWNIEVE